MRYLISSSLSLMLGLVITSCQEEVDCGCLPPPIEHNYSFENGGEGWKTGFADYPVGEDEFYELESEVAALPSPLDSEQQGLMISGNNHSDDLFMYLAHPVTNLAPNSSYKLVVEVEVASNAPDNSFGIGGSPGSGVYLKAGAATTEPKAVQTDGFWEMNLDKGNQSQSGANMQVLGTVGTDLEDFTYDLVTLDNRSNPITVQTNDQGELWVIIGTDSGFEGVTTLYYNHIRIQLLQ